MRDVVIADADLLDEKKKKETFPNVASMKISGYHLDLGDSTRLARNWDDLRNCDIGYISKVFTDTEVPSDLLRLSHIRYGGTGFFYDEAPALPDEIEHHKPDYHLYDGWVSDMIDQGHNEADFVYFRKCAIGRLTKGCFMGCEFCVNKNCTEVKYHADINEFDDEDKSILIFIDDQFLGYEDWEIMLDKAIATGKPFQFRQGLDMRVMTHRKAQKLASANYYKDYIFAFDNLKDEPIIRKNLEIWRQYTDARTKFYVFCGYNKYQRYPKRWWAKDIERLFNRVFILAEYDCASYVMRHKDYGKSPFKTIYNEVAAWCNQPWALRTMTFRQFCIGRGMGKKYKQYKHDPERYLADGYQKGSQWRAMETFEKKFPTVATMYFDKKYSETVRSAA